MDNQLVGTLPVIPLEPNQLNLFPSVTPTPARRAETLVMSLEALLKWKSQIFEYQQKVRRTNHHSRRHYLTLPLSTATQTKLIHSCCGLCQCHFIECQLIGEQRDFVKSGKKEAIAKNSI
ncbi:hypothetical protein [Nostoc flagelliforme]|uniref:hypothetical protein n=1 Tax=Nostoc flagelliforme TaxID=1306274 RepID=UPI0012FD5ADD